MGDYDQHSSSDDKLQHLVLIPLMAQGHLIPMVDMARILAARGVLATVVTTPSNAARVAPTLQRATGVRLVAIPFPSKETGLPDGCESVDSMTSSEHVTTFFNALCLLKDPLIRYLRDQADQGEPPATCIVTDFCQPWGYAVAEEFGIPWVIFQGTSCFSLLCHHNVRVHNAHALVDNDHEAFIIPELPPGQPAVRATRLQTPGFFTLPGMERLREHAYDAEARARGVVVNSFRSLEPAYVDAYAQALNKKVWTIGPVAAMYYNKTNDNNSSSSRNGINIAAAERGNRPVIDGAHCLSWLDAHPPRSVVFLSFGSLAQTPSDQLVDIALGLEASGHPFIWVVKSSADGARDLESWLARERFEDRVGGRGLVIRGWAPQVLILNHPSLGTFVTHCGWNSALEGIAAGLPLVTWPHFAEQFLNEKFLVDVLRVAVAVGVRAPLKFGADKVDAYVGKEGIEKAIREVMGPGEEAEGRRRRAQEAAEEARRAMAPGGSSDQSIDDLISYIAGVVPAGSGGCTVVRSIE